MAFLLSKESDKIKVVARCDDSLKYDNQEDFDKTYSEYLEDLDESKLTLSEGKEPTRFVLKKNLDLTGHIKIKNDQIKMTGKGDVSIQMGYTIEEVRLSLVDIENPHDIVGCLEYKKDGAGGASKDLMEKLCASGIVDDLHLALTYSRKNRNVNKKN